MSLPRSRSCPTIASAVLGVLALLLASLPILSAGTPAAADPASDVAVRIQIDDTTTAVTSRDQTVRLSGTITNTGSEDLFEVAAAFWISQQPLTDRSMIATAAGERPGDRPGTRIADPEYSFDLIDQVSDRLRAGSQASFELAIPADQLGFGATGSYLVGTDIRGTPEGRARETVGQARTLLPWVAPDVGEGGAGEGAAGPSPVDVGVVLPLTAPPAMLDGRTALDAAVLRRYAPNGRLAKLLELGAQYDVTWLVDPALIDDARTLTHGVGIKGRARSETKEASDRAAEQAGAWLERAKSVLNADNTLLLPYGDPDLSALQRRKIPNRLDAAVEAAEDQADYLGLPLTLGDPDSGDDAPEPPTGQNPPSDPGQPGQTPTNPPTSSVEPSTPIPSTTPTPERSRIVGWPGEGYADTELLADQAAGDIGISLLSGGSLSSLPTDGTAPLASISTSEGAVTALAVDSTLSAGGPAGGNPTLQARQRMLAETTALSMLPKTARPRRVVDALPRDFQPNAAGKSTLEAIEKTPWLRLSSPIGWLADPPKAYVGQLAYPSSARRAELPEALLNEVVEYDRRSTNYVSMLAKPDGLGDQLDEEFLRGASTSWRGAGDNGVRMLTALRQRITRAMNEIKVLDPRFVTLSSRSGRFPVTVWNRGDVPVQVVVDTQPRDAKALSIDEQEPVTIQPRRKSTVQVQANAAQAGVVQVRVSLQTPNGTRFGNVEDFALRSTDYGLVGWAVIAVGLGLFVVMIGFRIVKRIRARARS